MGGGGYAEGGKEKRRMKRYLVGHKLDDAVCVIDVGRPFPKQLVKMLEKGVRVVMHDSDKRRYNQREPK